MLKIILSKLKLMK